MSTALFLLDLVALVGGTVHTMEPDAQPAPATVLVADGLIEAILPPDAAPPDTARVVDVSGMHVLPGLIDGMVYFDPEHDSLYVAAGITTVRDLGGNPVRALLERDPAQRDRTPGPALLTPGAVVDGDPPTSAEAVILRTPQMADELLPILFNEDIDFLSVQLNVAEEPFRRAAALAHEQGLRVWGPVPRALDLETALAAGLDGVVFLDRLLPEGIGWDKVLAGGLKKGIQALADAEAPIIPLVGATALRTVPVDREPAYDFGLLDPLYEGQWVAEREFRRTISDEAYLKTGERVLAKQLDLLTALVGEGVSLVPGSASPQPWLFPGTAFHDELALFERAGLAPYDIVARATRENALHFGVGDTRGTIAIGKVADLTIVPNDPRAGVAALRTPEIVVLRGQVLDRERIADMQSTLRARLDTRREEMARPIEVDAPELPEGVVVLSGKVDVFSVGQRIRAERYAVVREPDGAVTYVGRTRFRGTEVDAKRETRVLQRTRNGKLDEFIVELSTGTDTMKSHGLWTADSLRIERRANGAIVDTRRVKDRVTCVDIGSVTSALLLTQLVQTDPFQIVTFHELLEPELALWVMGYGGEGGLVHYVRTHTGATTFQSTTLGSVELLRVAVGGGVVETVLVEESGMGGPGLPPPAEKLALVVPLPGTEEASAPAPASPDTRETGSEDDSEAEADGGRR